jgi:hypothetical protein
MFILNNKVSKETTVYKEALYQQMFAHRCVPHVFGINNTKKPYSLFMESLLERTFNH